MLVALPAPDDDGGWMAAVAAAVAEADGGGVSARSCFRHTRPYSNGMAMKDEPAEDEDEDEEEDEEDEEEEEEENEVVEPEDEPDEAVEPTSGGGVRRCIATLRRRLTGVLGGYG